MTEEQDLVSKPAAGTKGEPFAGQIERPLAGTDPATKQPPRWTAEFKALCSEASVVGLRYVANPSASAFRRSVWILLILTGVAYTTYQISDRTKYYFTHPTTVDIRVEYEAEMRFPSVTICNENFITLSGAQSLGNFVSKTCHFYLLNRSNSVKHWLITSAKEVMFLTDFVCLFVCLSVCLCTR